MKAKSLHQDELDKHVNASRIMLGRYVRGDNAPSIEVLLKLAKAFKVCLDYLVDEGVKAPIDKEMINRLENVENMLQEEKLKIFHFIDLIIRYHKAGQAYANK